MNTKTLIIDDDEISVMLTEILLEDSPFSKTTLTFSDGVYALEHLKAEYDSDTKYIIILDINMPLMDGWEFLEQIKEFASQSNTLVFMLSSSTDKLDIEKADNIELVKAYFSKPLTEEHLGKITECINK